MRKEKTIKHELVFAIVMAVFLVICPWITYMKIHALDEQEQKVFEQYGGYAYDFFIYYKAELIIAIAVFLVTVMAGQILFTDHKDMPLLRKSNRRIYLCMAVYAGMVLISSFLSEHEGIAKNGTPSQGEGYLVLLAYAVLCLGAMNYFHGKKALRIFRVAMTVLCTLTIILTMVEFFYKPLVSLPFAKYFITSKDFYAVVENLDTSKYSDFVSLTFYNPNYFGGFCMLLFPFAFYEYLNADTMKQKAGYFVLSAGIFFCELSAKSSAPFYLVLAELVILMVMHGRQGTCLIKKGAVWIGMTVVLLLGLNLAGGGKLVNIGKSVLLNQSSANTNQNIFRLTDISLDGNQMTLYGEKESFTVVSNDQSIHFLDTGGERLEFEQDEEGRITFPDERYQAVSLLYQTGLLTFDLGYNGAVDFYLDEDVFYGIGQQGEKLTEVSLKHRFGTSFYPFFTGRGYVWCLSAALLPETFLCGKGPGNFAFYCTQNDYVGLLNTHGTHYLSMDKPHSLYLQMWIDIGGIAVLAYLALLLFLFLQYFRWKKAKQKNMEKDISGCADWLMVSIVAFIIYSVLNDSLVAVTFLAAIFFGILFGITGEKE